MRKSDQSIVRTMATAGATEWMSTAIENAEKFVREMKKHRQQFTEAAARSTQAGHFDTPVNIMGWFVQDISNMNMNWRLDLVANHSAALALTEKPE